MLKEYKVKFTGRKVGAIGVTYEIKETVKAETKEKALEKLYENYEHISGFTILQWYEV